MTRTPHRKNGRGRKTKVNSSWKNSEQNWRLRSKEVSKSKKSPTGRKVKSRRRNKYPCLPPVLQITLWCKNWLRRQRRSSSRTLGMSGFELKVSWQRRRDKVCTHLDPSWEVEYHCNLRAASLHQRVPTQSFQQSSKSMLYSLQPAKSLDAGRFLRASIPPLYGRVESSGAIQSLHKGLHQR